MSRFLITITEKYYMKLLRLFARYTTFQVQMMSHTLRYMVSPLARMIQMGRGGRKEDFARSLGPTRMCRVNPLSCGLEKVLLEFNKQISNCIRLAKFIHRLEALASKQGSSRTQRLYKA